MMSKHANLDNQAECQEQNSNSVRGCKIMDATLCMCSLARLFSII
jgi:hypothetical protein